MDENFQPEKDDKPLSQYLNPLSIPSPQGFRSLINELELVPTAQGRQPTEVVVTGGDQQPQSEEHIVPTAQGRQPKEVLVTGGDRQPQSEEHMVVISEQLIQDTEASEDSLFSEPMHYSGWLSFLEDFILGPNQRNQIWRLRLLSGISFYIAAVVGFLFYLRNTRARAPHHYQMVMLIMSVGAPIVVAVFSLFVSFWFACAPNRWSSWITGLSVANSIMLCSPLAIFWAQVREAGN